MDKSFITQDCRDFCDSRGGITIEEVEQDPETERTPIAIHQPGPGEHAQNGVAECLIKHQVQDVFKQLTSMELPNNLWGPCLLCLNDVRTTKPSFKNHKISRAVAWGFQKTSLKISPMMPFGTRLVLRIPLSQKITNQDVVATDSILGELVVLRAES